MDSKEQLFTRTVKDYKSTIYAVCYMFSKDKDEINDLFQEILIRLWKGYDSFEGKADIKTWIYRVSLNTCLDQQKSRGRRADTVSLTVDIDPFEDVNDKALQELEELRSQYNDLKKEVDRQQIINERLLNASMKNDLRSISLEKWGEF